MTKNNTIHIIEDEPNKSKEARMVYKEWWNKNFGYLGKGKSVIIICKLHNEAN